MMILISSSGPSDHSPNQNKECVGKKFCGPKCVDCVCLIHIIKGETSRTLRVNAKHALNLT